MMELGTRRRLLWYVRITVWRRVIFSTMPEMFRSAMLIFSPTSKGLVQLSVRPLMMSARTSWAANPATATRRLELVSRVVLRFFVVSNIPVTVITAKTSQTALTMLPMKLMWILSFFFVTNRNTLEIMKFPQNHMTKIIKSCIARFILFSNFRRFM